MKKIYSAIFLSVLYIGLLFKPLSSLNFILFANIVLSIIILIHSLFLNDRISKYLWWIDVVLIVSISIIQLNQPVYISEISSITVGVRFLLLTIITIRYLYGKYKNVCYSLLLLLFNLIFTLESYIIKSGLLGHSTTILFILFLTVTSYLFHKKSKNKIT